MVTAVFLFTVMMIDPPPFGSVRMMVLLVFT